MFLQEKETGNLLEVIDVTLLVDPTEDKVPARDQAGQEEQDPEKYSKTSLVFPSGESLPRCWVDADYRNN
ncbi:acetyltransferase [Leptolyngbya sp. AN03gr2]|uniref:acetyltransferase n=1 Tax=unclassified Leptolyngbya TaxID=2650499 RepID=UPI003D31FA34